MKQNPSVLIVGGGVIGCSIAYELACRGVFSTIIDKGAFHSEATGAAAGMLGAQAESHRPGPLYELCIASRSMYRSWTDRLYEISGIHPQYIEQGIVRVAMTEEDEQELKSRITWMGSGASWLTPEIIREIEPGVSNGIRGGMHLADDHQVHPIMLAKALRTAVQKLGCEIREWSPALQLIRHGNRIAGIQTASEMIYSDYTIVASGAWSSLLVQSAAHPLPVFPVKGQCFSVRPNTPLIRKTVFTKGCYALPKMDGTIWIGATQEETGFDKTATLGSITGLNETAMNLIPGIEKAEFIATWTGLRPGTPDGLPYIGAFHDIPGLLIATGHYRNGILLAPITGVAISQYLLGETTLFSMEPFSPDRISGIDS